MPDAHCWFCASGSTYWLSAQLSCRECGEFTDPQTGGPWLGSESVSAPNHRRASPAQIAEAVAQGRSPEQVAAAHARGDVVALAKLHR